ncbi:unnamed protein product [Heterobilharzia americana]|nr:unnamed protein product [Heterobilharzia americana]
MINDLNEYHNDFSNILEITSKDEKKRFRNSTVNKAKDLYKLVAEIIELRNNLLTVSSYAIEWDDFGNELNTLIEWTHDIICEFKVILSDYENLLIKMEEFEKLYEETKQTVSDKSLDAEIDVTSIVKNQKSPKTKLIKDLEAIKEYQMFSLRNDFKFIKQQANRLYTKPQSSTQFRFMDDVSIVEFCDRSEKLLDELSNNLNAVLAKYKSLLDDENQLVKLYNTANEWVTNYERELSSLEENIPIHVEHLQSSPTHKHIGKYIKDANDLETKHSQGEQLLDMLVNKFDQYDQLPNSPEFKTLYERITALGRSRLNTLKTDLLRIKENLDTLESNGNNLDEELSNYESQLSKLEQKSTTQRICNLEDLMKEDISMWRRMAKHRKAALKPSKDYLTDFKKRYDKCLNTIKRRTEEIERDATKLEKLKEKLRDFNKSFEDACVKFKKMINQLKLEFSEQYSYAKLSEVCHLFNKNLEQIMTNLNEFYSNVMEKLEATQTDISNQILECELKVSFQSSWICHNYTSFKCELTDYMHDLGELNNELVALNLDIVGYEKWVENLEKQYQRTKKEYSSDEILFSKSNIYLSNVALPANELDSESNNNSANLIQLNSYYQKSLQRLRELQKLSMECNPPFNILSERFLTLIRQLVNTHTSFIKAYSELQSDRQAVSNRVKTDIDFIEQVCSTSRQAHQTIVNQVNEDTSLVQTKLTYLTRLIQSNKDLDAWIKEFSQLIDHSRSDSSQKQYLSQDHSRTGEIQLKLDIGKTYVQPVHEWVEQLKQNELNTSIQDLLTHQISRSNQIFQYAAKQVEGIKHEHNKQNELLKSFEIEFISTENWFKKWKENYTSLKVKTSNLLSKKSCWDEVNNIDLEIDSLMDCFNELKKELITKQSLLMNSESNLNTIEINRSTQKKLLVNEIKEHEQLVDQNIVSLKRVKSKMRELNTCLKKAKQWAGEIAEQLPRLRDGKSPIRISPYPLRSETIKSGHWKTSYLTDYQYTTNTITPQTKHIQFQQTGEFRSSTPPAFCSLMQQTKGKVDVLNCFIEEVTKSASTTAKDVNTLLDELEPDISELRINSEVITAEVDLIQSQVEQVISNAIDSKKDLEALIDRLSRLDDSLSNCKSWLTASFSQVKKISQQAISGITDLSVNQSVGDKEHLLIDIFCPLDGIIQNYQVFQSELMSRKSELTQLNSLCEMIQEKSNDSSAKNCLNQLLVQLHSLSKSCEDVLSKLQFVFMENREFQVLCNSIKSFLDSISAEIKGIDKGDQISAQSETDLNTLTNMREKLRSLQPKLLELSDRLIEFMFILHTNLSHHSTIQHGWDAFNTETVGCKAKRQLNEFRKEFSEISQQITEVSSLSYAFLWNNDDNLDCNND